MELLIITHADFKMSIECSKFDAVWEKAKSNIGEQGLLSTYSWTDGVVSVVRETEVGKLEIEKGEQAPAVFFDNADYPIWGEFGDHVKEAQFGSELQGENDIRLAFELRFVRRQYPCYQPINTSKMANYTFIDTTFDGLDEYVIIDKT